MATGKSIAIVGATGAVGLEFLGCLEKRDFPVRSIRLLASARSAGKTMTFKGETLPVEELTNDSFNGIEIGLFSAGASISRQFAPVAVKAGVTVVDNSSAFRMDPEVPLVVPEVNPEDVRHHKGIIANPNCSTIIALVPVYAIHRRNPVRRMIVSTYQAASGAGAKAMEELRVQAGEVLAGKPATKKVFQHPIAFNLFSHNSKIAENGYNEEENKMVKETWKIFHDVTIKIAATCVRVPVFRAHSESIAIECERPVEESQAREWLTGAPGVKVVDDRASNTFPMPLDASGMEDVLVGRIRKDTSRDDGRGLCLFVAGDQLLKGAALNAVQIAEILVNGSARPNNAATGPVRLPFSTDTAVLRR
jgi:aspartate-semialdehyde dehydrogenase